MATMNISLPDPLKEYVEGRVNQDGYSTTSEYFRDLVRQDQKRREMEKLNSLLLEGLGGETIEVTPEYIERKKAELYARMTGTKKSGS